jgi:NADPH2:quinone reductase
LQSLDAVSVQELRERVAAGLTTTFLSHYTQEVSLAQALQPEAITAYSKQATGEKFLITPNQAR